MSKIQVLDQSTINQIAAGEVIDRPASIVKELMENAIDAGSSMITIEIKDGGTSMIRITDNGCGIDKEDISIAFLRHSTSKIKTALDLLTVSSLGFRGEALSSIAAVCQVELITKVATEMTGIRYKIEGGKEVLKEEIGAPEGTTFIVRNIFFNTPARRKFLKTPQTETGYISDIIEKIALSHPEISIHFISNGQTKIHTAGNGNLKDVIYSIYGKDITQNVIEIHGENDFMKMDGFIGKPIISRGNRNCETYFINGRYIKSNIINKSIEDGYKQILMQHKYPFCVLNFEIPHELLDVNVHPAKMELRFRKGEAIYPWIMEHVHDALLEKPNIIPVELNPETEEKQEKISVPEPFEYQRKVQQQEILNQRTVFQPDVPVRRLEEPVKPYVTGRINRPFESPKKVEEIQESPLETVQEEAKPLQQKLTDVFDEFLTEPAKPKHKLVGQVFDTYWIIEYDNKMYIIDQHAAHEKVMFEHFMDKLKKKEVHTQMMNPPIILNLSMAEADLMNQYLDKFLEIGFEIENFGGQDFAVRGVPSDLYSLNSEDVLMEIVDNLSAEVGKMVPDMLTDKIASMSCKAAVKGNNLLTPAEMDALVDQLLELENPYNCPHGRPTIISMTKYELDKKFKRIV
ncbi:MAG: DNA mismatch repair endonuclease MutL [Eubacterium sp.]|nr:DNA mismatch repair endonuclease MutL [Eubacterium sp.]